MSKYCLVFLYLISCNSSEPTVEVCTGVEDTVQSWCRVSWENHSEYFSCFDDRDVSCPEWRQELDDSFAELSSNRVDSADLCDEAFAFETALWRQCYDSYCEKVLIDCPDSKYNLSTGSEPPFYDFRAALGICASVTLENGEGGETMYAGCIGATCIKPDEFRKILCGEGI